MANSSGSDALPVEPESKEERRSLTGVLAPLTSISPGWVAAAAAFSGAALAIGSSNYAFSIFVEPLEKEFGWSRTQISASLSIWALGSLTAPLIGRVMDRYGARPVMSFSLALMGLSFLLRPLMGALWHWYGLSVLQFVCFSGAALLPAGRLVGIWFPKTRGRVMGLTMMGNNFGGLVLPLIVSAVLATASWQAGYLVLGLSCMALAVLSFLVVRERPKVPQVVATGGSASGASESRQAAPLALAGWTVREALRVRSFYVITLVVLLGNFVYTVVVAQVYAHFTAEDVSKAHASIALSVVAAAGMAGKFSFGYLTERIPARFVMMLSFAGQIVGLMLMLNPAYPVLMWTGVPLFGLCMGAFGALGPLLVQEGFGLKSFGSIMGLVNLATVVPFALGPLLAGLSYDTTGSYQIAFLVMAAMQVAAILLLTQAKVKQAR